MGIFSFVAHAKEMPGVQQVVLGQVVGGVRAVGVVLDGMTLAQLPKLVELAVKNGDEGAGAAKPAVRRAGIGLEAQVVVWFMIREGWPAR